MKTLLSLLVTAQLLLAAMPFNLEGLDNLRLYFINLTEFIDESKEKALKQHITKRLKDAGFTMDARDPRTFFTKIEAFDEKKPAVIYLQIGIGEEIQTYREGEIRSFAFTYHLSDFIESDAPYDDTVESLNYLIDQFIEQYRDDQ
jgi:hypothetical protein